MIQRADPTRNGLRRPSIGDTGACHQTFPGIANQAIGGKA